ncbi:GntR family transcriptional regulator, partial [Sinorhizobium medicae]
MVGSTVSETIFFLDRTGHAGLQAQIRETIVSAVLSGRLAAGARLPSSRKLAAYLNISRITVTLAYQELASQGYIEAEKRSGYRVAGKPPTTGIAIGAAHTEADTIDWSAKLCSTFIVAKQMRKPLDWRAYPYPFLYGQMDPSLFDLTAWRDCARRALGREDFELMAGDFAASDD